MKKTVAFVAKDRPVHQETIRILEERGFRVRSYTYDQLEALLAQRQPPELVICEESEEERKASGPELRARLHTARLMSAVPVINVTVSGGVTALLRAESAESVSAEPSPAAATLARTLMGVYEDVAVRNIALARKLDTLLNMRTTDPLKLVSILAGAAELLSVYAADLTPEQIRQIGRVVIRANNLIQNSVNNLQKLSQLLDLPDEAARRKLLKVGSAVAPTLAAEVAARVMAESLQHADRFEVELENGLLRIGAESLTEVVLSLLNECLMRIDIGASVRMTGQRRAGAYRFEIRSESPLNPPDAKAGCRRRFADEMMRLHEGTVEIDEEEGTIVFTLPLAGV